MPIYSDVAEMGIVICFYRNFNLNLKSILESMSKPSNITWFLAIEPYFPKKILCENPVYQTAESRAILRLWWSRGLRPSSLNFSPVHENLSSEHHIKIVAITKHLCLCVHTHPAQHILTSGFSFFPLWVIYDQASVFLWPIHETVHGLYPLIHKCLLSAHCVSGAVLVAGIRWWITQVPVHREMYCIWGISEMIRWLQNISFPFLSPVLPFAFSSTTSNSGIQCSVASSFVSLITTPGEFLNN